MFQNRKKVLGMNERNLAYTKVYNKSKARKIADNKLLTKKVLEKENIPTPELLGHVKNFKELQEFDWDSLPKSFVIKPVSGLEGGGIEIFYNRDKQGNWIKADGSRWSLGQIQKLAEEIIDGKYSLHNEPDHVFFEERVRIHKAFQYYSYKGVPDTRLIVFNSMPIMSYVRLPTKQSNGKGNTTLGAIGAAIDIATGVTTTAVIGKSKPIEFIPGTRISISGLKIPFWDKILYYAVKASQATGLGYAAIDFLIDREKGPLVVELNARPGLSIQVANRDGLRWRLKKAKGIKVTSVARGVRLGKYLFGGDVELDIERISGKSLIGIYENVKLFPIETEDKNEDKKDSKSSNPTDDSGRIFKKKNATQTKAKIDTGADTTSIDEELAKKLGYDEVIAAFDKIKNKLGIPDEIDASADRKDMKEQLDAELTKLNNPYIVGCNSVRSSHGYSMRLYVVIKIRLGDYTFETNANIHNRDKLSYKMIIGRKSLSRFLVEPSKEPIEM